MVSRPSMGGAFGGVFVTALMSQERGVLATDEEDIVEEERGCGHSAVEAVLERAVAKLGIELMSLLSSFNNGVDVSFSLSLSQFDPFEDLCLSACVSESEDDELVIVTVVGGASVSISSFESVVSSHPPAPLLHSLISIARSNFLTRTRSRTHASPSLTIQFVFAHEQAGDKESQYSGFKKLTWKQRRIHHNLPSETVPFEDNKQTI